jgi:hypothetical protein
MDETGQPTARAAGSGDAEPGPGPRWLRFGLGLVVLSGDTLGSVLDRVDSPRTPGGPGDSDPAALRPSLRHAAWGLLVDLLDRGQRAPDLFRASLLRAATSARWLAPPLAGARRLARHLPGANRSVARWHAWRARRRVALARWAAAGQREEAASRAVAQEALTALRERALARVADSPDLKRVIHEQSEGIAVTAVNELRNRSARADRLAERAVRRLLGRGQADGAG